MLNVKHFYKIIELKKEYETYFRLEFYVSLLNF